MTFVVARRARTNVLSQNSRHHALRGSNGSDLLMLTLALSDHHTNRTLGFSIWTATFEARQNRFDLSQLALSIIWTFPGRSLVFRTVSFRPNAKPRVSEGIEDARSDDQQDGDEKAGATSFCWIDLTHQDEASLEMLANRFRFHPLTIEDCLHFDQRPKLESYDDYLFLVLQGFRIEWDSLEKSDALEVHFFLGKQFLVTVHEHPIAALDTVWDRVVADGRLVEKGTDHLCYLVADALIDSYFPLIDEIDAQLDDLEDRVLQPAHRVKLGELLDFKRLLVDMRRILSPQRDVLALLSKRGDGHISDRVSIYFRDVYDHALRLHESVESARELIGNVRDAYLWNASQRTNEIVKRLTILSAIFLPLTFITGFFGQNFESLPFDNQWLMGLMLFSCVAIPAGMLFYFMRSQWFASDLDS